MDLNKFIRIHYFSDNKNGICGDDFKAPEKTIYLNTDSIESMSTRIGFYTPLTNIFIDNYFIIVTKSNHVYYLKNTDTSTELLTYLSNL